MKVMNSSAVLDLSNIVTVVVRGEERRIALSDSPLDRTLVALCLCQFAHEDEKEEIFRRCEVFLKDAFDDVFLPPPNLKDNREQEVMTDGDTASDS